jgi:hypothetical protein
MSYMTLKDRWIDALYSGQYIQTPHVMNYQGCMCALGVMCDVVDPSIWDNANTETFYDKIDATLQKAGFTPQDRTTLIALNDRHKLSFDEIADYVLQCQTAGISLTEGLDSVPLSRRKYKYKTYANS